MSLKNKKGEKVSSQSFIILVENSMFMMMDHSHLNNSVGFPAQDEDYELKRILEESKRDDPSLGPNPDNMTYEQLLELGDQIGKVSKGLTPQ